MYRRKFLRRYQIDEYQNQLTLFFSDGTTNYIRLDENSGRIITRKKVGYPMIDHPGILLGTDMSLKTCFVLHNHYAIFGTAGISNFAEYAMGEKVFFDNRLCANSPLQIIENGLNQVLRGERYKPLSYNCQTTTNEACHNRRFSDDADKWVGGLALGAAAFFIYKAANS